MKQDRPYNCGIFAARYLLKIKDSPRYLEKLAGTTEKEGTSHDGMKKIFKHFKIHYLSGEADLGLVKGLLPAIVNYQAWGDGHYGVVLTIGDKVALWDPGDGKIRKFTISEFKKRWFSKRYGKNWFIARR